MESCRVPRTALADAVRLKEIWVAVICRPEMSRAGSEVTT
jgi:hypothetical protein